MKQSLSTVGERFLDKKHLWSLSYHWHLTSSSVCSFYYLMIGCLLSAVSWVHVCHLFSHSLCSQCWFILCEEPSGHLIFLIIFIFPLFFLDRVSCSPGCQRLSWASLANRQAPFFCKPVLSIYMHVFYNVSIQLFNHFTETLWLSFQKIMKM